MDAYQRIAPVSMLILLVSGISTVAGFAIQRRWTDVEL